MTSVPIPEQIERQIAREAGGPVNTFVERIAEQLRGAAGAAAVYGAPVERDGVTVIPVAKVRWGFGGGSGTGEGPEGQSGGAGAGGGVSATPMGYIELRDGAAEFKAIRDPSSLLMVAPVILASGLATALIIGAVRRLIRR